MWVAVSAAIAVVRSVSDSVLGESVGLAAGIVGVVMLFDALLLALARREGRKRRTRGFANTDTLNV
ncbi:MAG: hypothetical protein ACR2OO_02450 [Thermomicrobiales bacterium]